MSERTHCSLLRQQRTSVLFPLQSCCFGLWLVARCSTECLSRKFVEGALDDRSMAVQSHCTCLAGAPNRRLNPTERARKRQESRKI
jgi:hypothetical protein